MDVDGDSDAANDSDSDMDDFSDDSEDGGVKLTPAPKAKKQREEKEVKGKKGKLGDQKHFPQKEPEKGMWARGCVFTPSNCDR